MVTVDVFIERLRNSGIVPDADLESFLAGASPQTRDTVKSLASELIRRGHLTKYQATAVWKGEQESLSLGNYLLLDVIAHGGMGTVYKAQHRRLKRVVALKLLKSDLQSPDALDRFHQEIEAAGKLTHRNIVAAFDADQDGERHFLVMEYVPGVDLDRIVAEQGPLALESAAACILQAARGLAYAHGRAVIHRDIKPANLLAATDDEGQPVVKVLDLGLAQLRGSAEAAQKSARDPSGRLTRHDRIMGTVVYMAPEQALDVHSTDQRSDVYALGCTLYYLVNGRPMYDEDSVLKKLIAHREAPIPPLCDALPVGSEALDAVFQKMVAKSPADRYQSMDDVIQALEQCGVSDGRVDLTGRAGTIGKPTTAPESSVSLWNPLGASNPDVVLVDERARTVRRRGIVLGVAGLSLVLLVVAGLTALLGPDSTPDNPPQPPGRRVAAADPASPREPTPAAPETPEVGDPAEENPPPTAPIEPPPGKTDEAADDQADAPPEAPPAAAPAFDPVGEYQTEIGGTPWGICVRRENPSRLAVQLLKGGFPGAGWDGETIFDLTADADGDRFVLVQNPRLSGAFEPDRLVGIDALGEPFVAQRIVRASPTLGQPPPAGAETLFDGSGTEGWVGAETTLDGWLLPGAITKSKWQDFRLHLEFRLPQPGPDGEAAGPCDLIIHECYRLRITDSFARKASVASAGAVVNQRAPTINPCLPPGQWQTFDLDFSAPQFDEQGEKTAAAHCSLTLNGVKVHDGVEIPAPNLADAVEGPGGGPLALAGESGPPSIVFRNIWLVPKGRAPPAVAKPDWPEPKQALLRRMRGAAGMIHDEFALVQTLPLDDFPKVAEWFTEAGYRPVRLRPYATAGGVQTAALWTRDGIEWVPAAGAAEEIQTQDERLRGEGYWPVDVAGYPGANGAERYLALWARLPNPPADEARLFLGVPHLAYRSTFDGLPAEGYAARVYQIFSMGRGRLVHSAIWWKTPQKSEVWNGDHRYYESKEKHFQVDVCVARGPFAGVPIFAWCSLPEAEDRLNSTDLHGLSPAAHLRRCNDLADEGYRPAAIGVAFTSGPDPLQAASVWHRESTRTEDTEHARTDGSE